MSFMVRGSLVSLTKSPSRPHFKTLLQSGVFFYPRIGSFKHEFQANPHKGPQRLSGCPDRLHGYADSQKLTERPTEPLRCLPEPFSGFTPGYKFTDLYLSYNARAYGEQIIKYSDCRPSERPQSGSRAFQVSGQPEALRMPSARSQHAL